MVAEGIITGVIANAIYEKIKSHIPPLNKAISRYFPVDRGYEEAIIASLAKCIERNIYLEVRGKNLFGARTKKAIEDNIDLIAEYFVDTEIIGDEVDEQKLVNIIATSIDLAKKDPAYTEIHSALSEYIGYVSDDFKSDVKKDAGVYQRQILRIIQSVRRINEFFDNFDNSFRDLRASEDIEFLIEYCHHLGDICSTFRHFGYPSHMRPKQDLEVAYVPLSFRAHGQIDPRTLNSQINEFSNNKYFDSDNSFLLLDIPILAIVGSAGSGKTSLLQWTALQYCKQFLNSSSTQGLIPFLVPLRKIHEYSDSGAISVDNFASMSVDKNRFQLKTPTALERRVLKSRKAVILLDGVDELAPEMREEFWSSVVSIVKEYPGNRIIITSRPIAGVHVNNGDRVHRTTAEFNANMNTIARQWRIPDNTLEVLVDQMSGDQIENFVDAWHNSLDEKVLQQQGFDTDPRWVANVLRKKLRDEHSDLIEFCSTPLLCAMLCALHFYNGGEIPDDKPQLFRDSLTILVSSRDIQRKIQYEDRLDKITEAQRLSIVQHIALKMQASFYDGLTNVVRLEVPKERVIEWIADIKDNVLNWSESSQIDADALYNYVIERLTVIREPSSGFVDFLHRSFLEYLSASAWPLSGRETRELAGKISNDQWHDTLRYCANTPTGGTLFASQLLSELLEIWRHNNEKEINGVIFSISAEIYKNMKPKSNLANEAIFEMTSLALPVTETNYTDFGRVDYAILKKVFDHKQVARDNNYLIAKLALINNDRELLETNFMKSEDPQIMMLCNWGGVELSKHSTLLKYVKSRLLGDRIEKVFLHTEDDLGINITRREVSINARLLTIEGCASRIEYLSKGSRRINLIFLGVREAPFYLTEITNHVETVALYGYRLFASEINKIAKGSLLTTLVGVRDIQMDESELRIGSRNVKVRNCSKSVESRIEQSRGYGVDIDRTEVNILPY